MGHGFEKPTVKLARIGHRLERIDKSAHSAYQNKDAAAAGPRHEAALALCLLLAEEICALVVILTGEETADRTHDVAQRLGRRSIRYGRA